MRGVHRKPYKSKTGWEYNMPGALTPQQVKDLIPKDILVANWFWHDVRAAEGRGEPNDIKLVDWGFQQIHANFMYNIQNYARRTARPGVIGAHPRHGRPPMNTRSARTSCSISWGPRI